MRTIILALVVALAHSADADYVIKLDRPDAVGDLATVHAVGSSAQTTRLSIDGAAQPERAETLNVAVDATVEVLAVSGTKRSKMRLVVAKALVGPTAASDPLLPADAVVVAERSEGATTFTDGTGAAYPKAVQQALDLLFSIGDPASGDDAIFGTTERKKVGDRWPVAADYAAKKLEAQQLGVAGAKIEGTTTLAAVVAQDGVECESIAATLHVVGVQPRLPPGMAVTASTVDATFSGLFPVDTARRPLRSTSDFAADVTATGKAGPPGQEKAMTIAMTMKRHSELTVTPAAK